ncbi:MAG TPA: MBL fold metallo-hydrolase [Anaerolineae bacterium]|nr:MBL fold metallo-hydrolase [Anaerolineae bacterium]
MQNWICVTCGVQFGESVEPPLHCPICEDERQYVGQNGQQWTTVEQLAKTHHNRTQVVEPHLVGIGTEPSFAIGQRALLVQTPQGNILWDCTPLLDSTTVELVRALGGIRWIAVSHPHLVSTCVDWSRAFDNAPIYWHADNREWTMRREGTYVFWENETCDLADGLTLIRCGGHFPGSAVLHWANGAEGRGGLLAADTIMVVSDRRSVSFMYSYPNIIPLDKSSVLQIVNAVEPYAFDRIYGGWWHSILASDAKNAVHRSAERYIKHIEQAP